MLYQFISESHHIIRKTDTKTRCFVIFVAFSLFAEFVPYIEQLFDEDVLIGNGWTVNEGIRPLAYSTLADFAHHVRSQLSLPNLALAVHLFSKNVHDESLLISIQRMSCKVS